MFRSPNAAQSPKLPPPEAVDLACLLSFNGHGTCGQITGFRFIAGQGDSPPSLLELHFGHYSYHSTEEASGLARFVVRFRAGKHIFVGIAETSHARGGPVSITHMFGQYALDVAETEASESKRKRRKNRRRRRSETKTAPSTGHWKMSRMCRLPPAESGVNLSKDEQILWLKQHSGGSSVSVVEHTPMKDHLIAPGSTNGSASKRPRKSKRRNGSNSKGPKPNSTASPAKRKSAEASSATSGGVSKLRRGPTGTPRRTPKKTSSADDESVSGSSSDSDSSASDAEDDNDDEQGPDKPVSANILSEAFVQRRRVSPVVGLNKAQPLQLVSTARPRGHNAQQNANVIGAARVGAAAVPEVATNAMPRRLTFEDDIPNAAASPEAQDVAAAVVDPADTGEQCLGRTYVFLLSSTPRHLMLRLRPLITRHGGHCVTSISDAQLALNSIRDNAETPTNARGDSGDTTAASASPTARSRRHRMVAVGTATMHSRIPFLFALAARIPIVHTSWVSQCVAKLMVRCELSAFIW